MTNIKDFQSQKASEFEKKFEEDIETCLNPRIERVPYVNTELSEVLEFLHTAIAERDRQWVEALKIETKSVDELLPIMGYIYKNLSVQVAYKEGYNKAVTEITTRITAMSPEGLSDKRSEEGELEVEEKVPKDHKWSPEPAPDDDNGGYDEQ